MRVNELILYQVYPMRTFVDEETTHGILEMIDWIPHLTKLGANAVYFSPIFSSSSHGYDTKDYRVIDERLGTNEDFKKVCDALHEAGLKVIVDGVFNHVGREFWAFLDVKEKKWDSPYKDWFHVSFDGNSNYDDGFWYEGWEGHFELVKLNLDNDQVRQHLIDAISMWMDDFGIDGLRLDVAYMVNRDFMRQMAAHVRGKNPEFMLIGEMLHGDYKEIANPEMLDTVTNYECYKGLYSSLNSKNMHEIAHSLNRQFGPEEWTLYKGLPLYNFVDNHDVERIATCLENKAHLPLIYALAFGMPGFPCIYYGSEWGIEGKKEQHSDDTLRPRIKQPVDNELSQYIGCLSKIRKNSKALQYGGYEQLAVQPEVLVFKRATEENQMIVAVNSSDQEVTIDFNAGVGTGTDMISGNEVSFSGGLQIPAYTAMMIQL